MKTVTQVGQVKSPSNRSKFIALAVVAGGFLVSSAHAAYADADAVVTAVEGTVTKATTAFLAAAALGVAFLIVRVVAKALKKGISIG